MTRTLRQRMLPMLAGGLVLGLSMSAPAKAEELRIGFIAPMTGIFAQIGKDMANGFQMYLDEHGNKLGGADVKFVVEDNQGKGDAAVTKAKKLVLSDNVAHVHRRPAGLDRLRAGAGEQRRKDALHCLGPGGRRPHPAPSQQVSLFLPHHLDLIAAASPARAMGLRTGSQERSSPSPPTTPSATKWSAASRRRSRTAAARSSRRSGRGWAKRTSGRTFRRSRATPMPSSR